MRTVSAVAVCALAVIPLVALSGGREHSEAPVVYALSSLATVRPRGSPPGSISVHLEAARGEWESFQVVVRAGSRPVEQLRVRSEELVGPEGARLAPPLVQRVAFITLTTPSSIEGGTGPWPDPLVPTVDAYANEPRNAFPIPIASGADAIAWIDLFVPRDAPPGRYRGQVVALDGASHLGHVSVELEVHRFVLPATSSLPTTFGFSTETALLGHRLLATTDAEAAALARRYALAALRHRLSLHGNLAPPPYSVDAAGHLTVDFRPYDAELAPFLDGGADPGGPAAGARITTFDLRTPARLVGEPRAEYLRATVRHLQERGWIDRVFDYTADEPPDAELPGVRRRAATLRAIIPRVPRLVTRALTPALTGSVDIWCPAVNLLDDKPDGNHAPSRLAYQARLDRGEHLWWYQGCMSHGCDIVGGDYFTGWPSLVIDAPAVAHRVFEWLTFRYRVEGELYYNTVEAYAPARPTDGGTPTSGDPWHDSLRHGGNGDGTLFYPGRPDVIGGRTPIPVESIRLARIRDGLEDYEYLRLYAARAGFAAADALAARVARRTFDWDHRPEQLLEVRHRLAQLLDQAR